MKNYSSVHTINIINALRNGIETEIEELESNGNITFHDVEKRTEFINDLLSEMTEQFENDMEYYGGYTPHFTDSVWDKIEWDKEYYDIEVIEEN